MRSPDHITSLDAAKAFCLRAERVRRGASGFFRYTQHGQTYGK